MGIAGTPTASEHDHAAGAVSQLGDGRERTADGRLRMSGPFFRPLSRDWAFGLWLGLWTAGVVTQLPLLATNPSGALVGRAAVLVIGGVLSAFGWLLVVGITIGCWRGYRVGYREGRRRP